MGNETTYTEYVQPTILPVCIQRDNAVNNQESAIIENARGGDTTALRILIERHTDMVYRIAYRIAGNAQDAEDICQESFIKMYKSLNHYRSKCKFTTWLYRLVVNCSLDYLRKQKRHVAVDAPHPEFVHPYTPQTSVEIRLTINTLMRCLSPKQRIVFVLRDLQDMPMDEIAQIMRCSLITVRVHLHQARQKLRRAWEADQ